MSSNLQRASIGSICLIVFLYAQIYTGIHQFNNPPEPVNDCSIIDHHLHQNQETHDCEICDFQLTIKGTLSEFPEITQVTNLTLKHALPSEPFSEVVNLRLSRAPPST